MLKYILNWIYREKNDSKSLNRKTIKLKLNSNSFILTVNLATLIDNFSYFKNKKNLDRKSEICLNISNISEKTSELIFEVIVKGKFLLFYITLYQLIFIVYHKRRQSLMIFFN